MSAAIVNPDGTVRQLDGRADVPAVLTAEDVRDPDKLARALNEIRKEQAEFRRRWAPPVMFFRDLVVDAGGATKYRLEHGFGQRVNFYFASVIDTDYADLRQHDDTDENVLVLVSHSATTVTVKVEGAG